MDSKRKRELEERKLEECVFRTLKHGDPNKLTESKVRKLAAEETGLDLTDPANRKIVKRTVENYFMSYQEDGSDNEKKALAKGVARKPAAKQPPPRPQRRRKLVTFDDEEEEEATPETCGTGANQMIESDDEEETKPAKKASTGSRNSGRNQTGETGTVLGESEELEQPDVPEESEEEDERQHSSRLTKKKRADDMDDGKKQALPMPAKMRHLSSNEDGLDDEDKEEKSSKQEYLAPMRDKRRQNVWDEDNEEAEGEIRGSSARLERKKTGNDDDAVCQLSKNRFVSVQNFNGKALVSIREYYEKEGKRLPTKKGISLTVEQWDAFKDGIPDIEAAIQQL